MFSFFSMWCCLACFNMCFSCFLISCNNDIDVLYHQCTSPRGRRGKLRPSMYKSAWSTRKVKVIQRSATTDDLEEHGLGPPCRKIRAHYLPSQSTCRRHEMIVQFTRTIPHLVNVPLALSKNCQDCDDIVFLGERFALAVAHDDVSSQWLHLMTQCRTLAE